MKHESEDMKNNHHLENLNMSEMLYVGHYSLDCFLTSSPKDNHYIEPEPEKKTAPNIS